MTLVLLGIALIIALTAFAIRRILRSRARAELDHYSISPQELASMLESNPDTLILDVRLPLDLLADSTIIPGARRIPPADIIADPTIVPHDRDAVVYCTCPGDKTSRKIIHRALDRSLTRIKLLRGGLGAWKDSGLPVEPYTESFRLYSTHRAS